MISLIYFIVAVVVMSLAAQAFVGDRDDPARQAFLAFATAVTVAYSSFALSLLPGLGALRHLYLFAGTWVPAAMLWTIDRAFPREGSPLTQGMRLTYAGTVLIAPVAALLHGAFYDPLVRTSPPSLVAGLFALFGFVVALRRLWDAQESTSFRVDRNRLRYLFAVVALAIGFTMVEQLGRVMGPVPDPGSLSLSTRAVVLQGPLPPFSAVFAVVGVYFLSHTVVMSRLLDLTEVLARMTTLLLSAGALVLIDGLTFLWVDTFTVYPFHGTFQIFLASLLFLAAYDPFRSRLRFQVNRALNRRGFQLLDTIAQLRRTLSSVITDKALTTTLLDALHRSGRVPECSVYLWDGRSGAFVCRGSRSSDPEKVPLQVVAEQPFAERLARGAPWYTRSAVARRAQHDSDQGEVLALMDAMNADVTFPFTSGDTVLGWFHVRDEPWSDGYSAEEILALQELAARASVALTNVRSFAALEEQKRLAALGEMSAGLAHEIRNPLAGLKGAAQVLEGEQLSGDSQEMLQVIVDECERLDVVVSQFLDYARPFELHTEVQPLNALVTHAVNLMRAQRLPDGIELVEELAGDLPPQRLDGTRITQVVINLLQNAIQAMPDGGVLTVTTQRRVDRRGRQVCEFLVRDTGAGIPPDEVEQLFIPFYTTKAGGTGLGLAICQRIVVAHDGEIDVQSPETGGTSFAVRLPLPRDLPDPP